MFSSCLCLALVQFQIALLSGAVCFQAFGSTSSRWSPSSQTSTTAAAGSNTNSSLQLFQHIAADSLCQNQSKLILQQLMLSVPKPNESLWSRALDSSSTRLQTCQDWHDTQCRARAGEAPMLGSYAWLRPLLTTVCVQCDSSG